MWLPGVATQTSVAWMFLRLQEAAVPVSCRAMLAQLKPLGSSLRALELGNGPMSSLGTPEHDDDETTPWVTRLREKLYLKVPVKKKMGNAGVGGGASWPDMLSSKMSAAGTPDGTQFASKSV